MTRIELGAQAPAWVWDVEPSALRDWAQGVEEIGVDWLLVTDHVVFPYALDDRPAAGYNGATVQHEALTVLAFLAACTSRVKLHTSVLVLPQREPVLVAKQAAEIDALSGGRLRLGVGIGWSAVEYEALGSRFSDRARRFEEALGVLKACWMQEPVSFDGRWTQLREMSMLPKPAQAGGPPVLIGGSAPAAVARAARIADGWMGLGFLRAEQAAEQIAALRSGLEAAGRDPDSFPIQWTTMLRDPERTLDRLRGYKDAGATWLGVTIPERDAELMSVDGYLRALETFWKDARAELAG